MINQKFWVLNPTIKQIINGPLNSIASVNGWIKKIRKQKNFWFVEMTDGSTAESLQTIIPVDLINTNITMSLGSSLQIDGKLVKSMGSMQNVEIFAEKIRLLGNCPAESYPIQKINNSSDYMRSKSLNFRLRTNRDSAITRLKNELFFSSASFFHKNDFIRIFPPILTEHDCEGGGEVFRVEAEKRNFFSKPAFLTVSTQLHLEIAAASFPRVYSFSPVFRAENQDTTRHLSEFWMLECEISFIQTLNEILNFIEEMLKACVGPLLESSNSNNIIDLNIAKQLFDKQFARLSYTEAVKDLSQVARKFDFPVVWGKDLQTQHERYLAEEIFKGPVFVTDYPAGIKPFYMKVNEDGKTVKCCDLLVPGIGEIVGGSLREDDYNILKMNIEQRFGHIDSNPLQWYLDLRKYGSVPHGGFGLGFDRFLQYISGTPNIRDIVMVPRFAGSIKF